MSGPGSSPHQPYWAKGSVPANEALDAPVGLSPPRASLLASPLLRTIYASFGPLWERFRRGEGALLAVNAAILWFEQPGLGTGLARLALSVIVIALLYELNDLHDAASDRNNPKKNQTLVEVYLGHRREQALILLLGHAVAVALAYFLLGTLTALILVILFGVNILYSTLVKGVPFLDVLIVGVWGGLYVALADASWSLCLLIGVMTSVMHIFQVLVDRNVDAANSVPTTAVFSRRGTTILLAGVVAALYAVATLHISSTWALLALAPLVFHLLLRNDELAWMLSRLCFAVIILFVLGDQSGSL